MRKSKSADLPSRPTEKVRGKFQKLLLIMVGIVLGQFILYGPSLVGQKILLPVDLLSIPRVYLPQTAEVTKIEPHDPIQADLISIAEMSRQFAVSEIKAGRWPMWAPYQYAGVPVTSPKYSPFFLLSYCIASPVILPWKEMLMAMVAGLGMYLFCRRVLKVGFWPAALVAWCYPLTGFFVFWQGYALEAPVLCLPWLLMAVDRTLRNASPRAVVELSAITGLLLVSGALDIAGQVLLTSGLFALWVLFDVYGRQLFHRQVFRAVLTLVAGWFLGFLLASPHLLPLLEYTHTGARMERRSMGEEERKPVGLAALPEIVLPNIYGSTQQGSLNQFPEGQTSLQESSAATYAGVCATLFLAPLAWCSRRHRSINLFWLILSFVALSWCLNVPGMVTLLRSPGLNMMSHNRFVFAASLAILAMAAVGLDVLWQQNVARRWWFWFPALLLGCLCAWCFYRSTALPEPIANTLEQAIAEGQTISDVHDVAGVRQVQQWFTRAYFGAGLFCGLGFLGWVFLSLWKGWRPWAMPLVAICLMGDLLWFAHDRSAQCDPALYYPRIPALEEIAKSTPGRMVGYNCLPAPLAQSHGLHDIRGYDAVDPARMLELLSLTQAHSESSPVYALTQNLIPRVSLAPPDGVRLSPILDMLGVRYLVSRDPPMPPFRATFHSDDYWVSINQSALPRAFVPRHILTVTNKSKRLEALGSPNFDPRAIAFIEQRVDLPSDCQGDAQIISEVPTRVSISVKMKTPGLVVLADLWDKGWNAYLNEKPVPILRANHAVRGVVVPAGDATLEFRYEPASLALGVKLMALALLILLLWVVLSRRAQRSVPLT